MLKVQHLQCLQVTTLVLLKYLTHRITLDDPEIHVPEVDFITQCIELEVIHLYIVMIIKLMCICVSICVRKWLFV